MANQIKTHDEKSVLAGLVDTGDSVTLRSEDVTVTGGGEVLIIGDTHFSAIFQGTHRDYRSASHRLINQITDLVESRDVSQLIFLGDFIGVKEQTIRDHRFLARIMQMLDRVRVVTGYTPAIVLGNHDFGGYTDVNMLIQLGYLVNPRIIDYAPRSADGLEVRFHIVNFGEESLPLKFAGGGVSEVALGHNDYQIAGATTWYKSENSINLTRQKNFDGLDFVVSGHIHTPSPEVYSTTISSGGDPVNLFYPGSPARVSERVSDVFYLTFSYNLAEGGTDWNTELFGLPSIEEEFFPVEDFVQTEEQVEEVKNQERLKEILGTLAGSKLLEGDLFTQLSKLSIISKKGREKAKHYLTAAMNPSK